MKTLLALVTVAGFGTLGYQTTTVTPTPTTDPLADWTRPSAPVPTEVVEAVQLQPIVQPAGGFNPVPQRPLQARVPAGYNVPPADYLLEWVGTYHYSGEWTGGGHWTTRAGPYSDFSLSVGGVPGKWSFCFDQGHRFDHSPGAWCDYHFINPDGSWTTTASLPIHPLPAVPVPRFPNAAPIYVWQP